MASASKVIHLRYLECHRVMAGSRSSWEPPCHAYLHKPPVRPTYALQVYPTYVHIVITIVETTASVLDADARLFLVLLSDMFTLMHVIRLR